MHVSTKSSLYRRFYSYERLSRVSEKPLTPLLILSNHVNQLAKLANLSVEEARKLQENTAKNVFINKIVTADQVAQWDRLSTGCPSIDSILRGGIPTNGITEIYGSSGVGKTQLLLQLALMVHLPPCYGGKEKGTIYICTEDVFPSRRFHYMAESFKRRYNTGTDFESNTFLEHCTDLEYFRQCVMVRLPKLVQEKNIGLIVIDSMAAPFRSENLDFGSRKQYFIQITDTLNSLVDRYNLVVICANQIAHDINTNKEEPCLGLAWSNNITYRLHIARPNCSTRHRILKIIFSPDLPNNQCNFIITQNGIEYID